MSDSSTCWNMCAESSTYRRSGPAARAAPRRSSKVRPHKHPVAGVWPGGGGTRRGAFVHPCVEQPAASSAITTTGWKLQEPQLGSGSSVASELARSGDCPCGPVERRSCFAASLSILASSARLWCPDRIAVYEPTFPRGSASGRLPVRRSALRDHGTVHLSRLLPLHALQRRTGTGSSATAACRGRASRSFRRGPAALIPAARRRSQDVCATCGSALFSGQPFERRASRGPPGNARSRSRDPSAVSSVRRLSRILGADSRGWARASSALSGA